MATVIMIVNVVPLHLFVFLSAYYETSRSEINVWSTAYNWTSVDRKMEGTFMKPSNRSSTVFIYQKRTNQLEAMDMKNVNRNLLLTEYQYGKLIVLLII